MNDDEWKRPLEILEKALKWKAKIIKLGLTRAKAKCPYCEGYWHGILAGPKKHLHMHCDGECKSMMME